MKKIALAFFFAFSLINIGWASAMPEKIVVMGQELHLKHQEGNAREGFIAEYIRSADTWDDWELLFAVRFIPNKNLDLTSLTKEVMAHLAKKKKEGDLFANGRVFNKIKDSSIAVDFLLSNLDKPREELFFEHNVFVYSKVPQGVVSYQIARRVYEKAGSWNAVEKFITDIPLLIGQMIAEASSPPAQPPFNIE